MVSSRQRHMGRGTRFAPCRDLLHGLRVELDLPFAIKGAVIEEELRAYGLTLLFLACSSSALPIHRYKHSGPLIESLLLGYFRG